MASKKTDNPTDAGQGPTAEIFTLLVGGAGKSTAPTINTIRNHLLQLTRDLSLLMERTTPKASKAEREKIERLRIISAASLLLFTEDETPDENSDELLNQARSRFHSAAKSYAEARGEKIERRDRNGATQIRWLLRFTLGGARDILQEERPKMLVAHIATTIARMLRIWWKQGEFAPLTQYLQDKGLPSGPPAHSKLGPRLQLLLQDSHSDDWPNLDGRVLLELLESAGVPHHKAYEIAIRKPKRRGVREISKTPGPPGKKRKLPGR